MGETEAAVAEPVGEGILERAERFALDQPLRRIVTVFVVVTGILAVLGTFQRLDWGFQLFDFDGEGKPLAAWTMLVLASAGAVSVLIGRRTPDMRTVYFVLGGFFVFMAVDEGIQLRERVQDLVNHDWQHLWAPIVAVGGVAWLLVLRRIWALERERMLMLAGAAAWFVSQVDEHFQSNPEEGRVAGYGALSGIEEILEVTGSALFLFALVGILHAAVNRDPRLTESRAWRARTRAT